ncbi:NACHT, LRR and PYD domains-containing protein 1b allele 2-like [Clarias gariepinus]
MLTGRFPEQDGRVSETGLAPKLVGISSIYSYSKPGDGGSISSSSEPGGGGGTGSSLEPGAGGGTSLPLEPGDGGSATSSKPGNGGSTGSSSKPGGASTKDLSSLCPSPDMEVFIPELFEKCAEDKTTDEYRFLCPHAGQFMCKLTKLMFEMEEEGEVLYKIVSWDNCPLDGLGQKEPAGPLYSINCHEGLIKYLHLPHCETRTYVKFQDDVKLTVAHVTGGNVEIIQPLKVTNTHVVIGVHSLSLFGLLRALIFQAYPIEAQVLLFYRKLNSKHRMNKLHMHLLPGNIPVDEVRKQHESNTYIETSATCELSPGNKYWPFSKNTDLEITIQPEFEKFKRDYGPNYHPTFEVFLNTDIVKITLCLLDEDKKEVWSRLVLITDTEAASPKLDATGANFMDHHREMLIQKVSSVVEIADCLKSKNMISDEMYNKINVPSLTSQQQMRDLYRVLNSGGKAVKEEVYKILRNKMPGLVDDLESGSSLT